MRKRVQIVKTRMEGERDEYVVLSLHAPTNRWYRCKPQGCCHTRLCRLIEMRKSINKKYIMCWIWLWEFFCGLVSKCYNFDVNAAQTKCHTIIEGVYNPFFDSRTIFLSVERKHIFRCETLVHLLEMILNTELCYIANVGKLVKGTL